MLGKQKGADTLGVNALVMRFSGILSDFIENQFELFRFGQSVGNA